jgi:flagellar basal body-associated protein FliL
MVKKGNDMNTTLITNQRLVTVLLVLLIILVVLLIIGIVAGFLMMGGMTLTPGAHLPRVQVPGSAGVNGGMMNDMMNACTNMMQNFQSP